MERDKLLAYFRVPAFAEDVRHKCIASFPAMVQWHCQYVGSQPSKPQLRMAQWLQESDEEDYRILMAYRESGKSHITGLYMTWKLLRDPEFTIVVLSANGKLAVRNSTFCQSIIQNFSPCAPLLPRNRQTALWQKHMFNVERQGGANLSESVNVSALRSATTGMHGKIAIMDDLETEGAAKSEDQRAEIWTKCQTLSSVSNKHLYVGTPHHEDTIYGSDKLLGSDNYYHVLKIPAIYLKDSWVPGAKLVGELANPDVQVNGAVHNMDWIEAKRGAMTPGMFRSQYLLEATSVEDRMFKEDHFNIVPMSLRVEENYWKSQPGQPKEYDYFAVRQRRVGDPEDFQPDQTGKKIRKIVAYWDPATGGKFHDDSVLAIVAQDMDNNIYLIHIQALSAADGQEGFRIQIQEVIHLCAKFGVNKVYVEENKHDWIAAEVRNVSRSLGKRFKVEGAYRTRNKEEFIENTLHPIVTTGRFFVQEDVWQREKKLRTQFRDYPDIRKNDYIDAVAGACAELKIIKGAGGTGPLVDKPFRPEQQGMTFNTYVP